MILLIAVLLGFTAGFIRAQINGSVLQPVGINKIGLVFISYLPQFFAFSFPLTRTKIPDSWIPVILIGSLLILLFFTWENRRLPGFWLLGLGLFCNFLAIVSNGGMMPLPPENAEKLLAPGSSLQLEIGQRAGFGKDVILLQESTNFFFLGDIFMLPEWMHFPLAFSIGDILISVGAFLFLYQLGKPDISPAEAHND